VPLTEPPSELPFSFANYADDFDRHIEQSIRGYASLLADCVEMSQYFVENGTVVCDIGCSTGRMLAAIRRRNHERAPMARYVGLDIEAAFQPQWAQHEGENIGFRVQDVMAALYHSTALTTPDWPRRTAAFLRGCSSVSRLEPAEVAALPELLIAQSLGSVLWRAVRWRAGLAHFGDVIARVDKLSASAQWLAAHEDTLLSVTTAANARP